MKNFVLAAMAATALAAGSSATAAAYNKISFSQLVASLQSAGVSVSGTSRSDVVQVGSGTYIWVTQCDSAGYCTEVNFFRNYVDVRPSLSAVNAWNNTKKIPEASINSDGTLHMEMWLSAVGVTDTQLRDTLSWFDSTVADLDYWRPWISGSGV
jgi:opacity protein-like surface antigen